MNILKKITQEELNEVIRLHELWLEYNKEEGEYADLNCCDLFYANLSNANLSNANLSNANLSYADLSHANLHNICLYNTDLQNSFINFESQVRKVHQGNKFEIQYLCAIELAKSKLES